MKLIPLLAAAGFTLVVPSLPGYTLSYAPGQPRKGLPRSARSSTR